MCELAGRNVNGKGSSREREIPKLFSGPTSLSGPAFSEAVSPHSWLIKSPEAISRDRPLVCTDLSPAYHPSDIALSAASLRAGAEARGTTG